MSHFPTKITILTWWVLFPRNGHISLVSFIPTISFTAQQFFLQRKLGTYYINFVSLIPTKLPYNLGEYPALTFGRKLIKVIYVSVSKLTGLPACWAWVFVRSWRWFPRAPRGSASLMCPARGKQLSYRNYSDCNIPLLNFTNLKKAFRKKSKWWDALGLLIAA